MNSSEEMEGDLSSEREVERLQLSCNDVAVHVYDTFLDDAPSSSFGTALEGSVAQIARLDT